MFMLMLFCAAGEQRSARAVGNQPQGVSGAEEGRHVWQHISLATALQHRRQSEEELKAVRDSWVYKPSFRAALQIPQSSITGSHALTAQPGCPSVIPHEGFCRKGLWNLSNTEIRLFFHLFIIMTSVWKSKIDWFSQVKTIIFGTVKLAYCEWLLHLNMRLCKGNVTMCHFNEKACCFVCVCNCFMWVWEEVALKVIKSIEWTGYVLI